eukprot:CFRG2377T1
MSSQTTCSPGFSRAVPQPPRSPEVKGNTSCTATFTFVPKAQPGKAKQLAFEKGSTLSLIKKVSADWYYGTDEKGETGLIPVKFVSCTPMGGRTMPHILGAPSLSNTTSSPIARSFRPEKSLEKQDASRETVTINISDLAARVREVSGATYQESVKAVTCVLEHLEVQLPQDMQGRIKLGDAAMEDPTSMNCTATPMPVCEDTGDFTAILKELYKHMIDTQNVNWSITDDSDMLISQLEEMQTLLSEANPDACQRAIKAENYEYMDTLLNYYQMDPRESVRKALLITYGAMGQLDKTVFSHGVLMTLPVELARSIESDSSPSEFLFYQLVFGTMLFSTAERLPRQCYDHWSPTLIYQLLDLVEDVASSPLSPYISESAFNTILSFNLHLPLADAESRKEEQSDHPVMVAVAQRRVCQMFGERLLLLVNRNEDPVALTSVPGDNHKKTPNSLLRVLQSLLSCRSTAVIFFTNDLRVLMDILIREIQNSGLDNVLLYDYLDVLLRLTLNTDTGTAYRTEEIQTCLADLLMHNISTTLTDVSQRILEQLMV